ncbi:MAG: AbrB/MazE/SpoVT family DNA-binding domain-containing protein [Candidatus Dormibacteria bacterium]
MRGSYHATMGERGRLVIPAELMRARAWISPGTRLNLLETDGGLPPLTRARPPELVRADLPGLDLAQEPLSERRAGASAAERG